VLEGEAVSVTEGVGVTDGVVVVDAVAVSVGVTDGVLVADTVCVRLIVIEGELVRVADIDIVEEGVDMGQYVMGEHEVGASQPGHFIGSAASQFI